MKTWSSSPVATPPRSLGSTGATVYHGSLYYRSRQSPTLLRYDLVAENIVARRELPHTGFHGQYPYSWGGYTDIDLAVDEKGLWAIYSTEKPRGAVIISQLDPEHLRVIRSWETNIQKNKVANAFMVETVRETLHEFLPGAVKQAVEDVLPGSRDSRAA
ncbi:hypothetical protein Q7C36_004128 [Tachysurus vachellii]|uniref:Myocilin n=1 Tax=Tachysurus vachellii TaxID=175792 RepID=A0AA88NNT8_TACVA|nr:hypothetical protein Q7C36_004128 [Tachysurus vachellii]